MTPMFMFILIVPVLGVILLLVNFVLAPHRPYKEKKTPFECGYHSFLEQTRTQFTISFFTFGLLFLIFDLELVLIFPYALSVYFKGSYGYYVTLTFIIILTLGFLFELGKNALKIETKQTKFAKNNT